MLFCSKLNTHELTYMNLQPSRFQGNNQIDVTVIVKCVISMKHMELLSCDKVQVSHAVVNAAPQNV